MQIVELHGTKTRNLHACGEMFNLLGKFSIFPSAVLFTFMVDHKPKTLLNFRPNGTWNYEADQLANGTRDQTIHSGPVNFEVHTGQQHITVQTRMAKMWLYLQFRIY
jgi:hypothetical protein